jgi:diguanylate cyclase (GGDEF)-like protein
VDKGLHRTGLLLEDAIQKLELADEAARDPLTGLVNRRGLEAAMGAIDVERGALVAVDLDHFKSLNDTLGHPAGDNALGFISRILQETVRDRDTAARIGGEEFAIWLPGAALEEAERVAERVRTRIAGRAWGWQGKPWPITASLGVAAWPESTNSRDNLIPLADQALYRAKQGGRNRVELA